MFCAKQHATSVSNTILGTVLVMQQEDLMESLEPTVFKTQTW